MKTSRHLPAHRQAAQPARRRHHFLRCTTTWAPRCRFRRAPNPTPNLDHHGRLGRQHAPGLDPLAKASPATVAWLEKQGGKNESPDAHPRPALAGAGRRPGAGAQPDVRMRRTGQRQIKCTGGFSDGSGAPG
jgi:hypothetical protein